jgi:hypothetical protein
MTTNLGAPCLASETWVGSRDVLPQQHVCLPEVAMAIEGLRGLPEDRKILRSTSCCSGRQQRILLGRPAGPENR